MAAPAATSVGWVEAVVARPRRGDLQEAAKDPLARNRIPLAAQRLIAFGTSLRRETGARTGDDPVAWLREPKEAYGGVPRVRRPGSG